MPSDVQAGSPPETALPSRSVLQQTTFREYLESLLVTILIVLYGTTFVVQTFKIPSPSMERTARGRLSFGE
jgi:signal peptidase I